MKVKVVYILSNIKEPLAFDWIIRSIDREKIDLSFILINEQSDTPLAHDLKSQNIPIKFIEYKGKKDILKLIYSLFSMLRVLKPNVMHCHLFEASFFGLLVGKILRIRKRIHTRHHSTFHWDYFPRAVWYDKIINYLSTDIVSISSVVSDVLVIREKVNNKKISLIHHGFDFKKFYDLSDERINKVKEKYEVGTSSYVVGVISRFIHWKGIQYIIPAFAKIVEEVPDAILLLANAKGDFKPKVVELLEEYNLSKNVRLVEFESDIISLYKLFDVFVHVPVDRNVEAFGQIYIEFLLMKVPSICTISGIASEVLTDKNSIIVDYHNSDQIYDGLSKLKLPKNRSELVEGMASTDLSNFALSKFIDRLQNLYLG